MMRIFLIMLIGLCSGCAFTTMQTPTQLEGGEFVFSGALDVPGGLDDYDPFLTWFEARAGTARIAAQATYGVAGYGDVALHIGTTQYTMNAGGSARYYATDWLTTGLQFDYMRGLDLMTLTPRVITATSEKRLFYGGVQSNIFFGMEQEEDMMEFLGGVVGVVGGIEYLWRTWRWPIGFHAEAAVSPFYFGQGAGLFILDEGTPGIYQVGVGVNLRY